MTETDPVPAVNRLPILAAVLGLALGGCSLHPANVRPDRAASMGNSQEFDAYASRRADDLIRMGATKDRLEAEAQAQIDAQRRYGSRIGGETTHWSWTSAKKDTTSSDLADALAKQAQTDR